ncbi:MAG: glutamate racemase [Bacteroidales bacterium]|nr:glutamate racemase [Bacteroidales bacterium]
MASHGPIGVFDSGYGGLTILRSLRQRLPQYSYLYLGDNARAPYGTRSFDIVTEFTLEAVRFLFRQGCPLVILACNTASAKALRTIQQRWLPVSEDPSRRILGVIRPTAEFVGKVTANGHIGVFATPGTIASKSYDLEIAKLHPGFTVTGHACPMWVPLVENGEADGDGTDYFIAKDVNALMKADPLIDSIILGCTHYPLLYKKIRPLVDERIRIIPQGEIVADSLADYLRRHPEMDSCLDKGADATFMTTERADRFASMAKIFMGQPVTATGATL